MHKDPAIYKNINFPIYMYKGTIHNKLEYLQDNIRLYKDNGTSGLSKYFLSQGFSKKAITLGKSDVQLRILLNTFIPLFHCSGSTGSYPIM